MPVTPDTLHFHHMALDNALVTMPQMMLAQTIAKGGKSILWEKQATQEYFLNLCALVTHQQPDEDDPANNRGVLISDTWLSSPRAAFVRLSKRLQRARRAWQLH